MTKQNVLLRPVDGSIISRRSQIIPHFSNSGIKLSSKMLLGILPQNTCNVTRQYCIKSENIPIVKIQNTFCVVIHSLHVTSTSCPARSQVKHSERTQLKTHRSERIIFLHSKTLWVQWFCGSEAGVHLIHT